MSGPEDPDRPRVRLEGTADLVTGGAERAPSAVRRRAGLALLVALALGAVLLGIRHSPTAPAPQPDPASSPRAVPSLYVSECDAATVYRLTPQGVPVRLSGTPARGSAVSGGGPVAGGSSACPDGLAFDATGARLVVSAPGGRLRVVGDGGAVTLLDGSPADPRRALGLRALLASPDAVGVDRTGTVYVGSARNARVLLAGGDGVLRPLPGADDPDLRAGLGDQARPALLAVADDLSVAFADFGSNRVFSVDRDGRTTTLAGTGVSGDAGDGGPATRAQLDDPRSVALDRSGRLQISEGAGHRVRRVEVDGTISTLAGTGQPGSSGDLGPASAATLTTPGDLAVDPAGGVYVVDLAAGAVRRIDPDGTITTLGT